MVGTPRKAHASEQARQLVYTLIGHAEAVGIRRERASPGQIIDAGGERAAMYALLAFIADLERRAGAGARTEGE